MINWANMGDPNASLPTPQPVYYRPMYGSFGSAMPKSCISFVSRASHDAGIKEKYGLQRIVYPVHGCRQIGKPHMVLNGNMPKIDVNPRLLKCLSMAGRLMLNRHRSSLWHNSIGLVDPKVYRTIYSPMRKCLCNLSIALPL